MFLDKRIFVALMAMAAAPAVLGCSDGAGASSEEAERSSDVSSTLETTTKEYRFAPKVDKDVIDKWETEIWASVYRPATLEAGKRYPLLLFMHGNHATCGTGTAPHVDTGVEYTSTFKCPPGSAVVESHKGFGYLATDLASSGYIVVSMSTNAGINTIDMPDSQDDPGLIYARGRLILKHLALLSAWDRGAEATPASIGASLKDHLDFNQVGLMGQGRGGEGVRAANALYREKGSAWPARIGSPVNIRAIFEVNPTDVAYPKPLDAIETSWAVLLPMCAGDTGLQGIRPFDRMVSYLTEANPTFKASLTAWGTNSNYFNTEWQTSDSTGCINHTPLFQVPVGGVPTKGVTGSIPQQQLAKNIIGTFFRANVGANRDGSLNRMFDPQNPVPPAVTLLTRVDRGFLQTTDTEKTTVLGDFTTAEGRSSEALRDESSPGVVVEYMPLDEHDLHTNGAVVRWNGVEGEKYFQINFAGPGLGVKLSDYSTLDLRIDRADSWLNSSTLETKAALRLALSDGSLSRGTVDLSKFVKLNSAGSKDTGLHSMLQTARIPLASFQAPLSAVRGLRFTFEPTSGAINLGHMRATAAGSFGMSVISPALSGSSLDNPPSLTKRFELPSGRPATRARASTFVQGRILSVATAKPKTYIGSSLLEKTLDSLIEGGTDIELQSETEFPITDDRRVLHVGAVDVGFSRFPDAHDHRRLTFTLTPEQRKSVRIGDELTVTCGNTQWNLGRLEAAHLAR